MLLFGYHKGQCFDNSEVYILSITYLSLLMVFNSVTGMGHGTSFRYPILILPNSTAQK